MNKSTAEHNNLDEFQNRMLSKRNQTQNSTYCTFYLHKVHK